MPARGGGATGSTADRSRPRLVWIFG
jgi:hypothetical protein